MIIRKIKNRRIKTAWGLKTIQVSWWKWGLWSEKARIFFTRIELFLIFTHLRENNI